jgi:hypothetical protein
MKGTERDHHGRALLGAAASSTGSASARSRTKSRAWVLHNGATPKGTGAMLGRSCQHAPSLCLPMTHQNLAGSTAHTSR